LNWPYLFDLIDRLSAECHWQGWVGCEYVPADITQGGTSRGLSWLKSV